MDKLRTYTRREMVFLALGTMDVCVIAPLFALILVPLTSVKPLPTLAALLGVILAVHYLARLALHFPLSSGLRMALLSIGMLVSGLLLVHGVLYADVPLLSLAWLTHIFKTLHHRIPWREIYLFLAALFLWWRGLVLAQRRLDSESVAFRFRLGVVMLATTIGIGGASLSWPYHQIVFIFFFASLLGIALARANDVGRQYGGSQSPFGLGWLATLVTATALVLLMAAGLASLLTGERIGQVLRPVLHALSWIVYILVYAFAWCAQFIIEPLVALFSRYELGPAIEEVMGRFSMPQPPEQEVQPREPIFTPEQLTLMRVIGVGAGLLLILILIAFSLYRMRTKADRQRDEVRESVWEELNPRRGLQDLLRRGRRRLDEATDLLRRSRLGRLFAALTIRRIYAHMGALAAERGYPRAIEETPYDYAPTLERAFPDMREEIAKITEAYVEVHYGELPERPADLEMVQAAWKQIRMMNDE